MGYNATAYKKRADGGIFSVEAVEVNADGQVIRACGFWSPKVGTPEFEEAWEAAQFAEVADIHIEQDGARGYREMITPHEALRYAVARGVAEHGAITEVTAE